MKIRSPISILLLGGIVLFAISLALVLTSGIDFKLAIVWNILSSLDINFALLPRSVTNTPAVLAASTIDSLVFAVVAVSLAALFFDTIKKIDLKGKLAMTRIRRLHDHVILVPYNSFADYLAKDLKAQGVKTVIIGDKDAEVQKLYRNNHLFLIGDPKSIDVYKVANIERAKYVIACGDDDLQNAMIVVTAKTAKPGAKIISRVRSLTDIPKLGTAGTYRMIFAEVTAGSEIGEELVRRIATS